MYHLKMLINICQSSTNDRNKYSDMLSHNKICILKLTDFMNSLAPSPLQQCLELNNYCKLVRMYV